MKTQCVKNVNKSSPAKNPKRKLGRKYKCACGCGVSFILNSPVQKYAPGCEGAAYLRKNRRYLTELRRQKRIFKSAETYHTCKCPTCEKTHRKKIFWTGNGIPKVFCDTCKTPTEDRYAYITIHDKKRRQRVRDIFEKWDEQIMEQQIERYTPDNYSQEELWALVEECR